MPWPGAALLISLSCLAFAGACTPAKSDVDSPPPFVVQAPPPSGPSCPAGTPTCPSAGSSETVEPSCCETRWVLPGTFPMGFSREEIPVAYVDDLKPEDRDHDVTVSGFFLDRFEITVERFSRYAERYAGPPAPGSGAHPLIPGSGWQSDWDDEMPDTGQGLLDLLSTNGEASSGVVNEPASGLTWFAAFAFCIWDGGRLPTEAEWEDAAAGGAQNRAYPWGEPQPTLVERLRATPLAAVGSNEVTRGFFGHDDLAGGVREWVLDWMEERFYIDAGQRCTDCANLNPGLARVVRGDRDPTCCTELDTEYRAAARNYQAPGRALPLQGARCARDAIDEGSAVP